MYGGGRNFFVFKINPEPVGDFDFGTIPREWSDEIELFGHAPMTTELRGLITTLRRGSPRCLAFTVDRIRAVYALPPGENLATPIGSAVPIRPGKGRRTKRAREKDALSDRPDESSEVGSLERAQKARRGPTLRSRSQAQSPGLMARSVSIAISVGGARRVPNASIGFVGDRALDDDFDSSTHQRRRRALEEINSVSSNFPSSGLPPPLRASGEGTSQVDPSAFLPDVEKGCELPSLDDMRERDAYVRMAVANAKAMEASNEYSALMEKRLAEFPSKEEQHEVEVEGLKGKLAATEAEKVAIQNDLDLMKEKHIREIEGREATALKERSLACRSLSREYDAVMAVVKDKLQKKKEETAAEIRLQEVRARIESLTEYSEGGFELEEELGRLRDREISLDLDYGVASVSDPSLSRVELPEVSGDLVDQE
ncbi:hypothetical protein F2Q69_00035503 [Brassica cretica]|uniref:Uncharacterized protein n=1 Tax=Brassica cretica TaxID=69181 RepID=A0A8S9SH89_BRACR|nr:hypothetical protein F2Q69_00035503 [Brassica cretica]